MIQHHNEKRRGNGANVSENYNEGRGSKPKIKEMMEWCVRGMGGLAVEKKTSLHLHSGRRRSCEGKKALGYLKRGP